MTISRPRTMKEFIGTKLREGRFSTPSEYIRSLIRDDQDLNGNGEVAALVRRLRDYSHLPRAQKKADTGRAVTGRRAEGTHTRTNR